MGKIITIFSLSFFLILGIFVYQSYTEHTGRSIASITEDNSCNGIIRTMMKGPKLIAQKIIGSAKTVTGLLGKLKFKVKHKILTSTVPDEATSPGYYLKYVKFLNDMLEKKVISKTEAKELMNTMNSSRKVALFWGENEKIYSNSIYQLASNTELKGLNKLIRNKGFGGDDSDYLIGELMDIGVTRIELTKLTETMKNVKSVGDVENLFYYVRFLKGQKPDVYPQAVKDLSNLFDKPVNSKFVKEFRKYRNNIQKKIPKFNQKIASKIKKENPGLDEAQLARKVKFEQRKYNRGYSKLYYGCKAKTQNMDRMNANKKLLRAMLGFEAVVGVGSFMASHWGEDKDTLYWKKLAFDMAVSLPWAAMRSQVAGAPSISMPAGMISDYVLGSALDIMPSLIVYQHQFGVKEKDVINDMKKILQTKEFQKYINEVVSIMQEDGVDEFKQEMLKGLKIDDIEKFSTSTDEREVSEVEELLRETIARKIYLERRGEWAFFEMGSVGKDLFVFNKIWGTQSSVRNIALAFWMYHILCTGQQNPKQAMALTFALFSTNRIFGKFGYAYLRRKVIEPKAEINDKEDINQ